jgi:HEAT repeat protein
MTAISQSTLELVNSLYAPISFVDRLRGVVTDRTALLHEIAAAAEPAAIFSLIPLTLSEEPAAAAAATTVRQLLERVAPLDLPQFDQMARCSPIYRQEIYLQWRRIDPADLPRLHRLPDGWAAVATLTCHGSGYVRAAAVRQLSTAPADRALPFLLLRTNDWVVPVRRAATAAVERLLANPNAETLARSLPLILLMRNWGRGGQQAPAASILQRLQQPEWRPVLARGLTSEHRFVRRECFRLALGMEGADRIPDLQRALTDPDPWIRHLAALQFHTLNGDELRPLAEGALADPAAAVRREALSQYAARFPADAVEPLRHGLLDPHPSVRDRARTSLWRLPDGFDVAEFYRDAVQHQRGRPLRAAILGLGEAGTAADARLLRPFASHASPKMREVSVRSLARLDAEASRDFIVAALADVSRRVSNAAQEILARRIDLVDLDTLREYALSEIWPTHTRLNALRLLAHFSKWVQVPTFLYAAAASDPQVALAARSYLHRWYGRDQRKPTPEQLQEIQEALRDTAQGLEPAVRAGIDTALRLWLPSQ